MYYNYWMDYHDIVSFHLMAQNFRSKFHGWHQHVIFVILRMLAC